MQVAAIGYGGKNHREVLEIIRAGIDIVGVAFGYVVAAQVNAQQVVVKNTVGRDGIAGAIGYVNAVAAVGRDNVTFHGIAAQGIQLNPIVAKAFNNQAAHGAAAAADVQAIAAQAGAIQRNQQRERVATDRF